MKKQRQYKIGDVIRIGARGIVAKYKVIPLDKGWDICLNLPGVGACGLKKLAA